MKIILTGSTSYLGSKFIELYGTKYEIFGVSMHDPENPVDLTNKDELAKAFNSFCPDIIIHLAADIGRDETTINTITQTNPSIVKNLIELALPNKTPFIFTSSEAVYGGKWDEGNYKENDAKEPRSPYGESKVLSEELLTNSGLPYLITRCHRYIGIWSEKFDKAKQFPDSIKALQANHELHLDSKKIFTPALINNICDIFDHYISNDSNSQIVLNVGIDKKTTYYELIRDIATKLGLDYKLVLNDGSEEKWPNNSSLNLQKLPDSGYPTVSYEESLEIIKSDFDKLNEK